MNDAKNHVRVQVIKTHCKMKKQKNTQVHMTRGKNNLNVKNRLYSIVLNKIKIKTKPKKLK